MIKEALARECVDYYRSGTEHDAYIQINDRREKVTTS